MNGIPKGWRVARLGELAEYLNGAAFKPDDWGDEGVPIIRIQNLNDPSKTGPKTRFPRIIKIRLTGVVSSEIPLQHRLRY